MSRNVLLYNSGSHFATQDPKRFHSEGWCEYLKIIPVIIILWTLKNKDTVRFKQRKMLNFIAVTRGWMASLTRWTWVWVNSGSWWWTGRPGVLRYMGSQRVGHDWATELNWAEPVAVLCFLSPLTSSTVFFAMKVNVSLSPPSIFYWDKLLLRCCPWSIFLFYMHAKSLQLCLTVCHPMDCSPPRSSVHGFSRPKYWSGLPCPPPGHPPHPGIKLVSLKSSALAGGFFTTNTPWEVFLS